MKYLLILLLSVSSSFASDELIAQIKKTSSVYNSTVQIDASNPASSEFELMLTNQVAYLKIKAQKLNTSTLTVINSDSGAKRISIPTINVHNFKATLDSDVVATTCDGSDVIADDTSCAARACNVTQRIISACNDSDCWESTPTTDRELVSEVSEAFNLASKVEISDCFADKFAGSKHQLVFSNENTSSSNGRNI